MLPRPCDLSVLLHNGRQNGESSAQFQVFSKFWELNKFTSTRKRFIDLKMAEASENNKSTRHISERRWKKRKKQSEFDQCQI